MFFEVNLIALFKDDFKFLGNLFKSPKILNLILFFIKILIFFFKYSSNRLNKKFISYFGLFQFSVEKVYKVKNLIFFVMEASIIFSTVLIPLRCPNFVEFYQLNPQTADRFTHWELQNKLDLKLQNISIKIS